MAEPSLPEAEPLMTLIDALRRLPGVGVRSARRMAYHLLQHDVQGAQVLGQSLTQAVARIGRAVAALEPAKETAI